MDRLHAAAVFLDKFLAMKRSDRSSAISYGECAG